MADLNLSPSDVENLTQQAQGYFQQAKDLAAAYNVNVSPNTENDAQKLLAASGGGAASGAASGASVGAAIAPALGPYAPIAVAVGTAIGAIIGAVAGFLSAFTFKHKPTEEEIRLAKEWDLLNKTIYEILQTVPASGRQELAKLLRQSMEAHPGPLPFCFDYSTGAGCVLTSVEGVRAAAEGLDAKAKQWIAQAEKMKASKGQSSAGVVVVLGALGLLGLVYAARRRRRPLAPALDRAR